MKRSRHGFLTFGCILLLILLCLPVHGYSDEAVRWFGVGNASMFEKNYTFALEAFDRAIEEEPGYFEAWNAKADTLNRAGEFSEALEASSQALKKNPEYVHGWINRGQILYNIGYYYEDQVKDFEKADTYYREQLLAFEKAILLDPENADAWFNKGYALAGMKRYDDAITAFDTVQSLDPAYPNLGLSQKQARVLRDQATPLYVSYALPLVGIFLIIVSAVCILWKKRSDAAIHKVREPKNQRARRKKEE